MRPYSPFKGHKCGDISPVGAYSQLYRVVAPNTVDRPSYVLALPTCDAELSWWIAGKSANSSGIRRFLAWALRNAYFKFRLCLYAIAYWADTRPRRKADYSSSTPLLLLLKGQSA
jgi:hypothetical protein